MPLLRELKARYGDMPSSHWTVFTEMMSDAKTIATSCVWIQKVVSYFVSACRSAKVHGEKCLARFEGDFGNATHEEINKPSICHFHTKFYQ